MSKPANRRSANRRSGNPAKRAAAKAALGQHSARPRSYPLLAWLHRQPRWLLPVATVLLALGGLYLPRIVGGICLLLAAALLGLLTSLAWPAISMGTRVIRVVITLLAAAAAVARMTGTWAV
ncbi:MAG TPA: DUF6703 family protein [Nocardioidaceae bacterium]|nr:DUF6703 family protein [Nocardioidaceae bacterium]